MQASTGVFGTVKINIWSLNRLTLISICVLSNFVETFSLFGAWNIELTLTILISQTSASINLKFEQSKIFDLWSGKNYFSNASFLRLTENTSYQTRPSINLSFQWLEKWYLSLNQQLFLSELNLSIFWFDDLCRRTAKIKKYQRQNQWKY